MRKSTIKTLIFVGCALMFLMVNTMAATPEKQTTTTISREAGPAGYIIPGPRATYYGSQIRIYFHNWYGSYVNDLDIFFGGWYWPPYYRFPWWYCSYYNPYYYPYYYPYFPYFDLIWYPYYAYYYPYPLSVYRWYNGYVYPGYPLYWGWWIYWPRFPVVWFRWTHNGIPVGPKFPVLAYDFYWWGPWYGAAPASERSSVPGAATATGTMNLTLTNNDQENGISGEMPESVVIDSIQIGYSNKMYPLEKLTWDYLQNDTSINWHTTQTNLQVDPRESISFDNVPASNTGMIYRAIMRLQSDPDPNHTIEYIVQYTTGHWSMEFPYKAGDIVTYGDQFYRCLTNHTSAPGLEPPNSASQWTPVAPPPEPTVAPTPPGPTTIPVTRVPTPRRTTNTPTVTLRPTVSPTPTRRATPTPTRRVVTVTVTGTATTTPTAIPTP